MFFIGYTKHTKKDSEEVFEYTCGVQSDVEVLKNNLYRLNLKDKLGNILSHYEMPEKDFFTLTMRLKPNGQNLSADSGKKESNSD